MTQRAVKAAFDIIMSIHGHTTGTEPCHKCGSSNNIKVYEDGYRQCFTPGCGFYSYEKNNMNIQTQQAPISIAKPLDPSAYLPIPTRELTKSTVEAFRVMTLPDGQYSPYFDKEGRLLGQKLRMRDKQFRWVGSSKGVMPFGYHLWKNKHMSSVILVEGEEDAMSIYQATDGQIAIFGMPFGAGAQSVTYLKEKLSLLDQFETVYIGLDNDDTGKIATGMLAELLIGKRIRVVNWPHKDASDSLQLGRPQEIVDAIYQAKLHQFDGIIGLNEISAEQVIESCKPGFDLSYLPKLQSKLKWLKHGAIYTLAAAPKTGKSFLARNLTYKWIHGGVKVGCMFLEEDHIQTAKEFLSIHTHKPSWMIEEDLKTVGGAQGIEKELQYFKDKGLYLWNHRGNFTPDQVLSKLRLMRLGLGCDIVILDNLSISLASGGGELNEANKIIADIVKLCQETGLCIINIVHLKKNVHKNKDGSDSHVVSASDVYGTGDLNKFSTALLALEKEEGKSHATLKILSNRTTGLDGYVDTIYYNSETGVLKINSGEEGSDLFDV
jgi:twinkle protein